MGVSEYLSLGIGIAFSVIIGTMGMYVSSLLLKKSKSHRKASVKALVGFVVMVSLSSAFINIAYCAQNNPMLYKIFSIISFEAVLLLIYYLNKYSRIIHKDEVTFSDNLKTLILLGIYGLIILLPSNGWQYRSFDAALQDGFFPMKWLTEIGILLMVLIAVSKAVVRTRRVAETLKDPILKEVYRWMKIGFAMSFLLLGGFFFEVLVFFLQPNVSLVINILYHLALGLDAIGMFSTIFSIYVAITLPNWIVHHLYKKYCGMWERNTNDFNARNEQIERSVEKLKQLLYD